MKNNNLFIWLTMLVVSFVVISLSSCSSPDVTVTNSITTTATKTTTQTNVTTSTQTVATPAVTLNISAAASLTDAVKAINDLYTVKNPDINISANFASSGTLQKQIEQGAPADVFMSAAAAQMNTLANENLIDNNTRKNLLNNKVVLIVPSDSKLNLTSFSDLTSDKVTKLAIGDPKSVPAGTYAQQAFDLLGITSQLTPKYVVGADVKGVLSYVESGNVDAGVVYSTDALISTKVKVVASAPDEINAKIVYPVAVVKATKNPDEAKAYLEFLFSDEAKGTFEKYGFSRALK